jgi:hypothetical protein
MAPELCVIAFGAVPAAFGTGSACIAFNQNGSIRVGGTRLLGNDKHTADERQLA